MTARPSDAGIEALAGLVARATPGPWCWEQCGEKCDAPVVGVAWRGDDPEYKNVGGLIQVHNENGAVDYVRERIAYEIHGPDASASANAALIVAAVNALPALLAAYRERDALRAALKPFAEQLTIDEIMRGDGPSDWAEATPERRVEMMGERKRQNTANILAARAALAATEPQP